MIASSVFVPGICQMAPRRLGSFWQKSVMKWLYARIPAIWTSSSPIVM